MNYFLHIFERKIYFFIVRIMEEYI